ncbi:MAG: STN domain-containing protein [Phenylobacterium sp.]|uniref:STN domain-containing protein n=1 Tax=Phenylobacterium sp. TaxID=1871053 RepID=UPI0027336D68|nr:STN domain-containing protein [Phenylobacterium sp.]MDP3749094.1 STN domain-containing protein [Phenylobacterium sp.]
MKRVRGCCRSSQLIYPAELVAGQRSLGLKERLSPDEALDRLLAGTGVAVQRSRPNVIVLKLRATPVVLGGAPETAVANSTVTNSDPSAPLKEKPGQTPVEASATLSEVVVTGTLIRGPGRERRYITRDRPLGGHLRKQQERTSQVVMDSLGKEPDREIARWLRIGRIELKMGFSAELSLAA